MKPITKVFLVIAALVLSLLVWAAVFSDNGALESGWNAVVKPINNTWADMTGDSSAILIPEMGIDGANNLNDADMND